MRKQIRMSCQSDQVSMYSRSSATHWSNEMFDRPLDLPGAGDARLHAQSTALPALILADLGRDRRPGTDHAHLSGEHVQELR